MTASQRTPRDSLHMPDDQMRVLRLLQLADSALPIGSVAHSFGLETLAVEDRLTPDRVAAFVAEYLGVAGLIEVVFCRHAYHLRDHLHWPDHWCDLHIQLSALKPARESRAASGTLGRRFLHLVRNVEPIEQIDHALLLGSQHQLDLHHSIAFGFVAGLLDLPEQPTILGYLQQSTIALVSACQRLMALGQTQASRIVWSLNQRVIDVAERSRSVDLADVSGLSFMPTLDLAAMRHPTLTTRLFVS